MRGPGDRHVTAVFPDLPDQGEFRRSSAFYITLMNEYDIITHLFLYID